MSDEQRWEGAAGDEVRKCIYAVRRAADAVEQAQRELHLAHNELEAAQRDLDTAQRVYFAGQQDLDRRIQAVKVTPQKQQWLKALAVHDVFGAGEMRQAAEQIGWMPSAVALRVLASEYRKAGYLTGVSHGVMKLNRDRIVAALGPIFEGKSGPEPLGSDELDEIDEVDLTEGAHLVEPRRKTADDVFEDDDLPF